MHQSVILLFFAVLVPNVLASFFSEQPHDATVYMGETANFWVGLKSASLYGYKFKWYVNDRVFAYAQTFSVVATEDLNNARIYVELYSGQIANKLFETSNTVFLRIKPAEVAPIPIQGPLGLPSETTVFSGDYLELSIQPQAFTSIQWFIDSVPIPGQVYPDLRMKVTTEHDNAEISVTVLGAAGSTRGRTILHVYWAKWLIAVVSVAAGTMLLAGILGGTFVLKKRGFIHWNITANKPVVEYTPVEQTINPTVADNQDPGSTQLELN